MCVYAKFDESLFYVFESYILAGISNKTSKWRRNDRLGLSHCFATPTELMD